jgi:addiction module RelE/StbE family toxin
MAIAPYHIALTTLAEQDFDEIVKYIESDNPARAITFVDLLQTRLRLLLERNPNAGAPFMDGRKITILNYVVLYDVDEIDRRVIVHMIMHGARDWHAIAKERAVE